MADNRSLSRVYTVAKKLPGRILFPLGLIRRPSRPRTWRGQHDNSNARSKYRSPLFEVERSWRALQVVLRSTNRDYSVKKIFRSSKSSSWKSLCEDDPSDLLILPLFILSQIITPDEGARPLIYLIPFLKISYRFRLGEMTCRDRSGRVV